MTRTLASTDVKESILDTIGDTPLVRLSSHRRRPASAALAKVESFNPGGSIKDRVAVAMIEAAERDGQLKPGGTIVEPTSGNTGTGLAIAARLKGYKVIAVMPDKMSREKIDLLRAYGAEVVLAPDRRAARVAALLLPRRRPAGRGDPGGFQPNQYRNKANPQAHYDSTGPGALGADRRQDHAPGHRRRHRRHHHRHRALPARAQSRTWSSSASTPRARSTQVARRTCTRT